MTWGIDDDQWMDHPIPVREANLGLLFEELRGSDAPTGHWSIMMAHLAMYCRFQRVVEIGVWKGATAACLAYAMCLTHGSYVGVDNHPEAIGDAWRHLTRYGLGPWATLLQGRSSGEREVGYDGVPIDLLFIDGDHTLEGVRGDWRRWTTAVRPGGWVFIDNSASEVGVKLFLTELFDDYRAMNDWDVILCQHSFGMAIFKKSEPARLEIA